jgi:hypothetical protein
MPSPTTVRSSLRRCGLVVCAALIAAPACAEVEVEQSVLDELASGHARVVVELRLANEFQPEGTLSEDAAAAQRQAIFIAQQSILTALADTDATLLRRSSTVPFLTLELGPDALAKLKTMRELIARIFADSPAAPN